MVLGVKVPLSFIELGCLLDQLPLEFHIELLIDLVLSFELLDSAF